MKESTRELVQALYNLGYTNVDVFTKDGVVHAKDIIKPSKKDKKRKKRKKI